MQELDENITAGRRLTDEQGVYHRHNNWKGRYRDIREEIEERLDFSEYDEVSVVDIGTSKGKAVQKFVENLTEEYDTDFDTYAVDVSDEHVQQANRQSQIEAAFNARVEELPLADDCFDVVICNALLPYLDQEPDATKLYDANQHYLAYHEINRILDQDGVAAIETVNRLPYEQQFIFESEDLEALLEKNTPQERIIFDQADHIKFYP